MHAGTMQLLSEKSRDLCQPRDSVFENRTSQGSPEKQTHKILEGEI